MREQPETEIILVWETMLLPFKEFIRKRRANIKGSLLQIWKRYLRNKI